MSSMPYRNCVSIPLARRARAITSRTTGPRKLPTCTVPDGVFESLTTCRPASRTRSANSSAQILGPMASGTSESSRGWPRGARPPRANGVAEFRLGPRTAGTGSIGAGRDSPSGDADDLVGEVAGGNPHDDLFALLLAQERAADGAFVG